MLRSWRGAGTGSSILEESDLVMVIPFCLLESSRGPVGILLLVEGSIQRWRRGRPTQELGHMSREVVGPLAVKSSLHKS